MPSLKGHIETIFCDLVPGGPEQIFIHRARNTAGSSSTSSLPQSLFFLEFESLGFVGCLCQLELLAEDFKTWLPFNLKRVIRRSRQKKKKKDHTFICLSSFSHDFLEHGN